MTKEIPGGKEVNDGALWSHWPRAKPYSAPALHT